MVEPALRRNGNGLWKYVATIAVTILIAGSPGMVYAMRTWWLVEDVEQIQRRQDDIVTRLTILEVQVDSLTSMVQELKYGQSQPVNPPGG